MRATPLNHPGPARVSTPVCHSRRPAVQTNRSNNKNKHSHPHRTWTEHRGLVSYDSLHRLTTTTDGGGHTIGYGYDLADNETSITYPGSSTQKVTRTFDQANRLSSLTDWLGNKTSFGYDADSNLTSTTFPSATGNTDSYSYNPADQMTSVGMSQGQSTLANLSYTRDPLGQLTNETQTGLPGASSTNYTYTQLNQLSSAGQNNYSYDKADNLTQLDGNNGYTYDKANELTSSPGATYSYDQLGERATATPTGSSPTTYAYDQGGRLSTFTPPTGSATSYTYNGDGLRTKKTTGSNVSNTTWDQTSDLPQALSDGQGSYIYGPDGISTEQIASNGTPGYLHHDQLGSTRLLTNQSGNATATSSYDPYGTLSSSTGASALPIGFAGQYTDSETGLQYDQARYDDPSTGQFLTRDPIDRVTRQPYQYAENNPSNNTDPSGLWLGVSWLPSPGQVGSFIANHARPIGEGLFVVGACVTPGIDVVTCPEAIVGVAAVNVGANDVSEYNAAAQGCSTSTYLRGDLFEVASAGLGLGVAATVKAAGESLDALSSSRAPTASSARTGINYLNGTATGAGLATSAAETSSNSGACGCES